MLRAFILVMACMLAATSTWAIEPIELTMFVGEAKVLNEPGVKRMAVGSGEILNATVLDNRQVLVLAEEIGQSTLYLWRADGEVMYSVNVISGDASRILTEIQALVPGKKVRVRAVGDKIIVEGNDLTDEESTRLQIISERYPQVINLASRVGLEPMIYTEVKIMEFRKTALRNIGIAWDTDFIQGPVFTVIGDIKRSDRLQPPERIPPFATSLSLDTSIDSVIRAAAGKGDAVFLAEPGLTTKSGGTAKFLAGGEVPIPLVNGFGQVSVQFKPYGVKLETTPVVGESGTISLKLFTELSAIDNGVNIGGIPAFLTRRSETEVNLRANETLMISGLFDASGSKNMDKVAGLGDIPIIGELFRSREFRNNKTELVIFMTPRLIAPSEPLNKEALDKNLERRQEEIEDKKLDK